VFRLFITLLIPFILAGQNRTLDSLKIELKNAGHDTARCRILDEMIEEENDITVWIGYNDEFKKIAGAARKKYPEDHRLYKKFTKYWASALGNEAYFHHMRSDYRKAIAIYNEIYVIYRKINSRSLMALTLNNQGVLYNSIGDVERAISHYGDALKIGEASMHDAPTKNDKKHYIQSLLNLGTLYFDQNDRLKAEEYLEKAAQISNEIGYTRGEASALTNLASVYDKVKQRAKACEINMRVIKLFEQIGDPEGVAYACNNLGALYYENDLFDSSLYYFNRALKIRTDQGDLTGISSSLDCMTNAYRRLGKTKLAESAGERSLKLALESGSPSHIRESAYSLYLLYKKTPDPKKALDNYELHIRMRDSLQNESTRKSSIRSQLKYEYEKQAAADSVAHAKENKVKAAELQRQSAELKAKKNQQYALFGGFFLVLVFAVFMYNRFKVTQKQKGIIEEQKKEVETQKELVEIKQREVLDSIQYAKRIQMAQIPSEKRVRMILKKMHGREGK
jgi:tetratricopeptide (TPR) repeat protein